MHSGGTRRSSSILWFTTASSMASIVKAGSKMTFALVKRGTVRTWTRPVM